ncbi:MAG TPA: hypothetical protein HA257_01735 [Candidatus Methanoperedenaceae archaeon]|nr:hypothetical protein [Candidatus Methanoperedenaceae archaeon]
MSDLTDSMKELKNIIGELLTYTLILDLLIVFLLSYIVLALFQINTGIASLPFFARLGEQYPFIPAAVGGVLAAIPVLIYLAHGIRTFKPDAFREVERKYPSFKERLRTAYDHRNEENIIVEDLVSEVSGELDKVRYSAFVEMRPIAGRIALVVLLGLVTATITLADIHVEVDVISLVGNFATNASKTLFKNDTQTTFTAMIGIKPEPTDIMGAPSVAKLEGETIDFKIYRGVSSELSMRGTEDEKPAFTESPVFEKYEAVSAESFGEDIPRAHQELIKNYFSNLSKAGG